VCLYVSRRRIEYRSTTHSASSAHIVRQLDVTSGSFGPVADSVNMLSFRSRFSTSFLMRSSRTLAFSAALARSFVSFAARSSSLSTGRPLASRMRFPARAASSASASSASCRAAFMSRARLIVPIIGMKRSPPNIAPNTSSGSTNPPSGALSFGPYSLYFRRRASSDSV
jgi:hypothetical protein